MARVDPILTFGCEVVLDVEESSMGKLAEVQHLYIRRLLAVGTRSILATLFTETGILPVRYRRVILAISYVIYLLQLPSTHYAYAAFQESKTLLRNGYPSWISDLNWVIHHLPGVDLPQLGIHVEHMSGAQLTDLKMDVERWCDSYLHSVLIASPKCTFLTSRFESPSHIGGERTPIIRQLRHYLVLPLIPAHRKAVTSIMLSTHGLAVERLRWRERYRAPVPRDWRLCRFCRSHVEDEGHALLECVSHPDLEGLRDVFRVAVHTLIPEFQWPRDISGQLRDLLQEKRLAIPLAKFIFDITNVFYASPVFIAPPYLYSPL
jgi:hypothetical protein